MDTKVSIITPCLNSEESIRDTIESVLGQSYQNIEYIIVDGRSTDRTIEIVKEYASGFEGRLRYISEKDSGIYDAMNKGILQASGSVIGIINSDDWYEPEAVEQAVQCFQDTGADVVYGEIWMIDEKGRREYHTWHSPFPLHPSTFIRREVYQKYGMFDIGYQIAADRDLLLRLMSERVRFAYVDRILADFRTTGVSHTRSLLCAKEAYEINLKYLEKCPGDYLNKAEMSGRLEEMPGEEGYPAYLASRLAQFYERAGSVSCLGSEEDRRGSLTAVGAVSPPGGDLAEPVSQGTMRIVKVFWALDASLAYKRHFPAINWLTSHSLYLDSLKPWFDENLGKEFLQNREQAMGVLQQESSLNEIVQLVGKDSLSPADQLTLETARMIREDFLQQNSFVDIDSFSTYDRQEKLLAMILDYDKLCRSAITKGAPTAKLFEIPARERIGRAKSVPAEEYAQVYADISASMEREIDEVVRKAGEEL